MEHNIRTFKDFLEFYNLMSQTCFSHCIDNFKSRELDPNEADCVEKCANKLIKFNNRTISIYADVQTKLMEKRQKEMETQAAKLEEEANKGIQQTTEEVPQTTDETLQTTKEVDQQ